MKYSVMFLLLTALLGLLAYTNPKLDNYDQFITQWITEQSKKSQNPIAGVLGSLFGGLAADLVTHQTVRSNYVLFSTYNTTFGTEHMQAIGVLNHFYLIEKPKFNSNK